MQYALIRGNNPNAFRSGEWARITGVVVKSPKNLGPRICFRVKFPDGKVDHWPVEDAAHEYEFDPALGRPRTDRDWLHIVLAEGGPRAQG